MKETSSFINWDDNSSDISKLTWNPIANRFDFQTSSKVEEREDSHILSKLLINKEMVKNYIGHYETKEKHYEYCLTIGLELLRSIAKTISDLEKQLEDLNSVNFADLQSFEQNINLDIVKQVSIADILGKPKIKTGKINWYCSPLRQGDRKPSFAHYIKENSWFDYGLGEGGDNITLVCKMNNLNFLQACKFLKDLA